MYCTYCDTEGNQRALFSLQKYTKHEHISTLSFKNIPGRCPDPHIGEELYCLSLPDPVPVPLFPTLTHLVSPLQLNIVTVNEVDQV